MRRALQLARLGRGFTSPNPMVGAVIVARDRIIGEGWHRRCGGPHAEVWAVRSVDAADLELLHEATVYVTLEPCSHYGKTPPCASMLVERGVARVVVGCMDPNPKVSGRGIALLRDAGIEVTVGVLQEECRELNRPFMIAQTRHRPYILLKWAQSADGLLDIDRGAGEPAARFSTPLSSQAMHALRAQFDSIAVGSGTVLSDDPGLDVRLIDGRSPRSVAIDRRGRLTVAARIFSRPGTVCLTSVSRDDLPPEVSVIKIAPDADPRAVIEALGRVGISSVMVEGGAELLRSFIDSGLWDDARVEIAPITLGKHGKSRVSLPSGTLTVASADGGNVIINVKNDGDSVN